MNGIIVKYDESRGFGFIRCREHEEDVFFHISEVTGKETVRVGCRVSFQSKPTSKGWEAMEISLGKMQASPRAKYGLTAVFAVLITAGGLRAAGVSFLWAYLIAVNAIAFLFYGLDKAISGRGLLRVPELVLHALVLFGGSLGAFAGQRGFRHKTKKRTFQAAYWLIVVLQAMIVIGVLYLRNR